MIAMDSTLIEKIDCVRHFLYFPSRKLANQAAGTLKAYGRALKVTFSAHSSSWLLLIRQNYRDEDALDDTRASFIEVAESLGGEYDGWECEIRNAIH